MSSGESAPKPMWSCIA